MRAMTTELNRHWLIAMAASAGGIPALTQVLQHIPPGFPAAIVIVLHRRATRQTLLDKILARHTSLPVTLAQPGERLAAGHIYSSGVRLWTYEGERHRAVRHRERERQVVGASVCGTRTQ